MNMFFLYPILRFPFLSLFFSLSSQPLSRGINKWANGWTEGRRGYANSCSFFFIFKTHLFLFGSHLVHLTSCYLSTIFTGPEKEKFSKALLCIQKKAEEMIEVTAEI